VHPWLRWLRQAGAAIIFVFSLSGEVSASAADHASGLHHVETAMHQPERGGPKIAENIEMAKFAIYIDSNRIIANHVNHVLCKDMIERNLNIFEVSGVYCNPFWAELPNVKSWRGWMRFNGHIRPMSYVPRWGLAKVFVIKDNHRIGAGINLWGAFNRNSNISAQLSPRGTDAHHQRGSLEQRANSDGRAQNYRNVIIHCLVLAFVFVFGGFFLGLGAPEGRLLSAKFVGSCLLIAFGLGLLWLICIPATLEWYL
jgi:hypothetical protein